MYVIPAKPRHMAVFAAHGIRIVIPSRRSVVQMLFVPIWLAAWSYGEVMAFNNLLRGFEGFVAVWFCAWTMGGIFAVAGLCWQLAGQEIFDVSERALWIRRRVFGFTVYTRKYALAHVEALRISPEYADAPGWNPSRKPSSWNGGPLAFDYGAATIRFGSGIDEAEAKDVLDEIRMKFPKLVG